MTLGDFWILQRNTKVFLHIYKKGTCIKHTYVFPITALHPKFITRNKPRWINLYVNSDVKPRKKWISLTLSYHLHLKDFYLFFKQLKAEDMGIMPTLLLSSHRKYYGVISVFPGHTPLGNSIPVQMSHPGRVLGHRHHFLIDLF